jgi:hypothetical protein
VVVFAETVVKGGFRVNLSLGECDVLNVASKSSYHASNLELTSKQWLSTCHLSFSSITTLLKRLYVL